MVKVGHPANIKLGGVCMYYKNCLRLKVLDIRFLHKSIAFVGDKLRSFISLYRSPSPSYDDFVSFLDNFELTLDILAQKNPVLMVDLCDLSPAVSTIKIPLVIKAETLKQQLHKMVYIKKLMNQHIFKIIPLRVLI